MKLKNNEYNSNNNNFICFLLLLLCICNNSEQNSFYGKEDVLRNLFIENKRVRNV